MPNTDLADLRGVFPTPLRWNAEIGVLGYGTYDDATGERSVEEIELGSAKAKFVMDLSTRERGYGLIRTGLYDMRLSPIGTAAPDCPSEEDFKPAIGCWVWNPSLGELRLETNAAMFRNAVSALWDRCRTFKEASQDLQPVINFVDRRERLIKKRGRTYFAPVINIIGWFPRNKIPPFALREPTVKPPAELDSQVRHAMLEHLQKDPVRTRRKPKSGSAPKQTDLRDFLDDELPEDL